MRYKIAVFGDRHVDSKSPRYQEGLRCWDWAIADASDQQVSGFVCTGDVCEASATMQVEGLEIMRRYSTMSRAGWVLEIEGNHEARGMLRLAEMLGVILVWDKILQVEAKRLPPPRHLSSMGKAWSETQMDSGHLMFVPYCRRGYAPFLPEGQSAHEKARSLVDAYTGGVQVIRRVMAEITEKSKPHVVFGHWTVKGFKISPSEKEHTGGKEMVVPMDALAGADLVVTGHVHQAQQLGNVVGVGSMHRVTWAEVGQEKSYLILAFDGDKVTWERRVIPTRPMIDVEISSDECAGTVASLLADRTERDLRVRVHVSQDDTHNYESTLAPLKTLPGSCVWELIRPESIRARTPEILSAENLGSEFRLWLEAQKRTLSPERQARVDAILESLETI